MSVSERNSSNDTMFEMRDHGAAYVSTFSSCELFPVFYAEDKIVIFLIPPHLAVTYCRSVMINIQGCKWICMS